MLCANYMLRWIVQGVLDHGILESQPWAFGSESWYHFSSSKPREVNPFQIFYYEGLFFMYAFTWGWKLLFASLREIAPLLRYDWKRAPLLQSYVHVIHGQCVYQEVPLFLTEKKHSTLIRIKPKKKKEFRTWNTDIQG